LIIVRERWPLPPWAAVAAGLSLVLLPLSGANGILFTPFFAVWLAVGVALYRREMSEGWIAPFFSTCIVISLALSALYFVGWTSTASSYPNPGFWPTLLTGARFIGMALGPVGGGKVPPRLISGVLFFAATILLMVSSAFPLFCGLRHTKRSERFRAFGLLVFAAAMAALVLAMAWGRAGWVPVYDMPDRYALLSVPALCAAYFAWILYATEAVANRVAIAFAIAGLLALPFNLREGNWWRRWYASGMAAFEQDLSAGLSWQELADKHYKFLLHWDRSGLVESMKMLHDAKIGPLGRAAPR
jgi:hypothetical protein